MKTWTSLASIPAIISGGCGRLTRTAKSSDASDSFKFTLVVHGKEQEMLLEVDATELNGNVVEVIGQHRTGRGADHQRRAGGEHSSRRAFPAFSAGHDQRQPRNRYYGAEPARWNGDQARAKW